MQRTYRFPDIRALLTVPAKKLAEQVSSAAPTDRSAKTASAIDFPSVGVDLDVAK